MLTSLRLVDFKNFADETLKLGPFTVIVGANASGKSNIRDAFRFLHGIGRGYTLAEILGGKHGAGGQLEWAPIRGAPTEIARLSCQGFAMDVAAKLWDTSLRYVLEVDYDALGDGAFRVKREEFNRDGGSIYDCYREGQRLILDVGDLEGRLYPMGSTDPFLSEVMPTYWPPGEYIPVEDPTVDMKDVFANVRFMDFVPHLMKDPAFPGSKLGDFGQNLAVALEAAWVDPKRKEVLLSWTQALTPMDVSGFEFPKDPSGKVHLRIVESDGRSISAYSGSDGTLRFLGILAALLSPEPAALYFIEEIDNGIHPSRLHLLIELIEKQTKKTGIQVVATTHSPVVLNLISDTTFENTSVVYRDEDSADAIIRPVSELPRVRELRESQGLGRLHAGGWMEDILSFEAADAKAIE